jgi:hypothetical protein
MGGGKRLDRNLVRQGREVKNCALNQVLMDLAIGWCGWGHNWIAQECREMIVRDPPNVGEDNHKRRETNLRLSICFPKPPSLVEPIQDVRFVCDHGSGAPGDHLKHHAVGLQGVDKMCGGSDDLKVLVYHHLLHGVDGRGVAALHDQLEHTGAFVVVLSTRTQVFPN